MYLILILLSSFKGKSVLGSWYAAFVYIQLSAPINLCSIYLKLLVHVIWQKGYYSCDFNVNWKKIKGGWQSCPKAPTHDSRRNFTLLCPHLNKYIPKQSGWFFIKKIGKKSYPRVYLFKVAGPRPAFELKSRERDLF